MQKLNTISRTLVGALFIVSGLIKANDAVGFSFKLQDYFAPDVLDIPFFLDYVYPLAVFICIAEILLGLAVLVGAKMRLTAFSPATDRKASICSATVQDSPGIFRLLRPSSRLKSRSAAWVRNPAAERGEACK